MYFVQSNKNFKQYICDHQLWVLARVTDLYDSNTDKGIKWLEPLWRSYNEEIKGISVFLSRMEAAIYSVFIERKFNEKWSVYSLNELNIQEMMTHNQAVQNTDQYHVLLNSGFWTNKDINVLFSKRHILQATIPITFNTKIICTEDKYATLKIPKQVTEKFQKMWRNRVGYYESYCKNNISSDNECLMQQAVIAYETMNLIECDVVDIDECKYITTWNNEWFNTNPNNLTEIK